MAASPGKPTARVQSDIRYVRVSLWNEEAKDYAMAGYIWFNHQERGFTYFKDYTGPPLDPVNLNYRNTGNRTFMLPRGATPANPSLTRTLHGVFRDLLPGRFAMELIAAEQAGKQDFRSMTDAEKLFWLGSRTVGALKIEVMSEAGKEKPIDNLRALDTARDASVRFQLKELDSILSDFNRYALTINGGRRPKAEYEYRNGQRWIAKFNVAKDPADLRVRFDVQYDPYNVSRVEHAFMLAQQAAGIGVAETRLVELPSGHAVLMVKRFDRTPGEKRAHTISLSALCSQSSFEDHGDYRQIADVVRKASASPEADVRELYRRMLFNAMAHNTDDHMENFMMRLEPEGYRLAPSFDVLPCLTQLGHHTQLCGRGFPGSGEEFIRDSADAFNIPIVEAREIARKVRDAFQKLPSFYEEAKLPPRDIDELKRYVPYVRWDFLEKTAEHTRTESGPSASPSARRFRPG